MTNQSVRTRLLPIFFLLIAMISIQSSATLAKTLFPLIGAQGVTALRLLFSALILLVVFRPWRHKINLRAWRTIFAYGAALGGMNLTFYMALETIPLGIAVALEFTGPLAVAMFYSRRLIDFFWIALAIAGLWLLLPMGEAEGIDLKGALLALSAGVFWALYIVFGKKAGVISGPASVALGSLMAACVIFPIGWYYAGSALFSLSILPVAIMIAVFASALPYALEMIALTRLPSNIFGILMSIEPAMAAFSGYLFLSERLTLAQWFALLCIILASVGAAATAGKVRTDKSSS